jgi:hypothetical protein
MLSLTVVCESYAHILTQCRATADVPDLLNPELVNAVQHVEPTCNISNFLTDEMLTQFIINPSSMKLPNNYRISIQHPRLHEVYSICLDRCFAVFSDRKRMLKNLP